MIGRPQKNIGKIGMGRGTIYLMISALIFSLSGYAIHIGLGRFFGPEKYGIYGVIITSMTVMNLMINSGIPLGTSKFLSEKNNWNNIIKNTRNLQLSFSILIAFIYFLLSPLLADILNDSSLTPFLQLSSIVIPFYALNSLYHQGFLNGYKEYSKQAISRISFSISKVSFIVVLVILGLSINGAILGYLIAAFIGFLIGYHYTCKIYNKNNEKNQPDFPIKKLIKFSIPIILYSISIFLIFNIDLLAVKSIIIEDSYTGFYTSASNIARLPYLLFGGLALTLFPSISSSTSKKNLIQSQEYISKSLRYMLMLLIPSSLLISVTSTPFITLLYSNIYAPAGQSLQILIIGLGFLAVFNVLAHVLMGYGKPNVSAGFSIIILLLALILNIYLIPIYGILGAALATTIVSFIGLIGISIYIFRIFKKLIRLISLIRIISASIIISIIAYFFEINGFLIIIEYILLFLFYLLILWIIKEIKKEDIITIKRLMHI